MKDALILCNEILQYEPDNMMIKDYKASLKDYIDEGMCFIILMILIS